MAEQATTTDAVDAPEGSGPRELLVAALAAFQRDCPAITKSKTATVTSTKGSYSYSYADLADVLGVVRPLLAANGLAIVQRTVREAGKVILITELHHVAGGVIDSEVELGQSSGSPQQFGGALTYLRRYELTTLLGIATEDDTDAQHVTPSNGRDAAPAPELPPYAMAASDARKRELVDALDPIIGRERAKAVGVSIAESFGLVPDGVVGAVKAIAAHYAAHVDPSTTEEARAAAAAQDAAAEAPQDGPPVDGAGDAPPAAAPVTGPAAGSIAPPDLSGVPENEWRAKLVEAGCSCPDDRIDDACPIAGHGIPF